MIGKTLAHYHVIAKLGEGGMGVVYRATDTRLGRDVAIKVLPATVASDPERLARFEREARTLASLNHPNIAAIYGVEQGALVMELVEGQTLAERIQAGAIPLDEALPIVRQIADALEAAHEKGIIHRDLKPANVKVTPDGVVKLLDFGLAKAMEADCSSGIPENSPTLTIGASRTGVIMGTAGYMSPEQARGGKVDRRTDIWAYGVVLYEMAAGRTLFQGETISDTLAAVLTKEPDLGAVPERIRPLLRRCLQRDAKKRLGWIGEAGAALDQPPAEASAMPPRRGWIVPTLTALLLVSIGSVVALLLRTPKPPELPVRRFTVAAPSFVAPIYTRSAVISPDGRHLAYLAEGRLWIRDLDKEDARALEGTDGAAGLFWSPDNRFIGFWMREQVFRVSVGGGVPIPVCRARGLIYGAAWSADGQTIFLTSPGTGLLAAPVSGGEPRVVLQTGIEIGGSFFSPNFLSSGAGGDWILLSAGIFSAQRMLVVNTKTGERRDLGVGSFPTYSPNGYIVFSRENGGTTVLWAMAFSLSDLKTTDEPFLVATGGALASVASDGTLIYFESGGFAAQLVLRDRGGKQLEKISASQPFMRYLAVSRDGRRAVVSSTEQQSPDIWIHDLNRSLKSRITFDPGVEIFPKWSPDGKQIVFRRNDEIAVQQADGGGEPVVLAAGLPPKSPSDWSMDGKYIVYTLSGGMAGTADIWFLRRKPDNGLEPIPFLQTRFQEASGRISPNGKYIAHLSDESGGRFELYVRPFPEGPGKWQVSTNGAVQPRWSRDGKELFYLEGETLMAVETSTQATFTSGAPKPLFATGPYQNEWSLSKYDVMPDDRFLILEPAESKDARRPAVHVIENWLAATTQSSK